jgi:hypothetical protein
MTDLGPAVQPRPRPGGVTLTESRSGTSTQPDGLELYLVPVAATSTSSRQRRPQPRPGGVTSTQPGVLDLGALSTTLSTAASLPTLTVPLPTGLVWRRGRWHGSPACEGVDGTDSTTTSGQRRRRLGGPGSRPDGARSGLNFFLLLKFDFLMSTGNNRY